MQLILLMNFILFSYDFVLNSHKIMDGWNFRRIRIKTLEINKLDIDSIIRYF